MVVACRKRILALVADAVHLMFYTVLHRHDPPARVRIEHVGHDGCAVRGQVPVSCILLAIEQRLCPEDRHLTVAWPERPFVVAVGDASTIDIIDVIPVGRTADIDVRLPYIAACGGMTVLDEMQSVEVYLMVDGKVGVSAEQFEASLERA